MSDFLARIKPKRSTVAGEKPSAIDLQVAELAINTADGKLFTKHTDDTIKEISGSGGSGGSINAIEDIGNVAARQQLAAGVLSWDVPLDDTVTGGWNYDGGTLQLQLNKEAKSGYDIRPDVVAMPTNATIWISFDNLEYQEIAYTSRAINAEVVVIDLIVNVPSGEAPASEIWVAFATPYSDGVSLEDDMLLYDAAENVWRPTPFEITGAADVDEPEDGYAMVWSAAEEKWVPGYPRIAALIGGPSGSAWGSDAMIGPTSNGMTDGQFGFVREGPAGDDSAGAITVPADFVGVRYVGQEMPATIYACTNGNIHWDATQGGNNGGRNGSVLADAGTYDFWLAHWSQDTAVINMWTRNNPQAFTIRAEYKIPYNQGLGCPVETTFYRDGSIRVVYGINAGSAINIGPDLQAIVSQGVAVVEGFGTKGRGEGDFTWQLNASQDQGNSTRDLADVADEMPSNQQVLRFNGDSLQYEPQDLPVAPVQSVNDQTGVVSLGIADMNDFYPIGFETFTASSVAATNPQVGEVEFTGSTDLFFSTITNTGKSWYDEAEALKAASDALDIAGGDPPIPIVFETESGEEIVTNITSVGTVDVVNGRGRVSISLEDNSIRDQLANGDELRVLIPDYLAAPGEDGSFLTWDSEFREFVCTTPAIPTKLDDFTDVDTSTTAPTQGQALVWNNSDSLWVPGTIETGGGGGGSGAVRGIGSVTLSQLLRSGTLEMLTLGKAGTFLQVTASGAAWVRFYSDEASRTADSARGMNDTPSRGSGVLLELIAEGGVTYKITPSVQYFNLDSTPASILYLAVDNLSGTADDLTIDVDALILEA